MKMDAVSDIQGLFEGRAHRGDFLTAGKVDDTIGLCLSGGGYRAMIYHVGAIIRLNELGLLSQIEEIASVSGGSITAGKLALAWPSLQFDGDGISLRLIEEFALPLIRFASIGIDIKAGLIGLLPGCSAADVVAKAYDTHLFNGASLQDIPDRPRFTFMTTNLQTGSGWRFAKDYAADFRVGRIDKPQLPLALVVTASSAFPPVLSPVRLTFKPGSVKPMDGTDLHRSPFIDRAVLTDGGVYDNLGLERIWKRCRTILVSNAGKTTPDIGAPTGRWIGQIFRTLSLVQQQAEYSRTRILLGMHNMKQRHVALWSINTPIAAYGAEHALDIDPSDTTIVATMRTRLNHFSATEINLLLKAGYAGADASLRARKLGANGLPASFSGLPLQ